jgi:hypothetical protein
MRVPEPVQPKLLDQLKLLPSTERVTRSVMPFDHVKTYWPPLHVQVPLPPTACCAVPSALMAIIALPHFQLPAILPQDEPASAFRAVCDLGSRARGCAAGSSRRSPEIDLSVLPSVPPVEPACAKAPELPAVSPMPRAAAIIQVFIANPSPDKCSADLPIYLLACHRQSIGPWESEPAICPDVRWPDHCCVPIT